MLKVNGMHLALMHVRGDVLDSLDIVLDMMRSFISTNLERKTTFEVL